MASLRHTGRRVVLGHTLNTLQHVITKKKSHNVLSKFTIFCWAVFAGVLGRMWTAGCGLITLLKVKGEKAPRRVRVDTSSRWEVTLNKT